MKRLQLALASILALTFAVAMNGYAWHGGPGAGMGMGKGMGMGGLGALWNDLSPEQQQKVKELRLDFMKKTEPLTAQLHQKRIELMELSLKGKADEDALDAKRDEMWAITDKIRVERRAMVKQFRRLLTPEQREKLGGFGMGLGGPGRGGHRRGMMRGAGPNGQAGPEGPGRPGRHLGPWAENGPDMDEEF